mgnify:CR=1 FL=1
MRKILCIICFLVFALLQVFSTESALRGMNGISANGNNFIPDFWADTLMVNPAFATELKAKWGLHLNNSLRLGIHGTANNVANKVVTDVSFATGVDPMVLINFSNFVFGIGGAANFGFFSNDTNGDVSVSPYVNAGAEALFAFNIKDSFRFGIDAKFVANLDGSLILRGVVTPGIIFSFEKNMLSLSAPIHLAYVDDEDLNGKFRFGIIFVDDLLISDKFTIRIPARADVKLYTTPSTCHVTVPFSAGISLIGKVNDPLLFFAGVDIGTSFGTASVTVDDNDKETVRIAKEYIDKNKSYYKVKEIIKNIGLFEVGTKFSLFGMDVLSVGENETITFERNMNNKLDLNLVLKIEYPKKERVVTFEELKVGDIFALRTNKNIDSCQYEIISLVKEGLFVIQCVENNSEKYELFSSEDIDEMMSIILIEE